MSVLGSIDMRIFIKFKVDEILDFIFVFTILYVICLITILEIFKFFHNNYEKAVKCFQKEFKNCIIKLVCNCFPKLSYSTYIREEILNYNGDKIGIKYYLPQDDLILKKIEDAVIIPDLSAEDNIRFYTRPNDYFYGIYKGISFDISEIKVCDDVKTFFKGMVIRFNINKKIKGHTIIYPDSLMHISPSKNLHHTILEDVEFEKKFDVYTNDDVEARYLITTTFMDRLNNIKMSFDADKIYAAFHNGMLLLGLNTKLDLFDFDEISYIKKEPLPYNLHFIKTLEGLISIYKLIDYFKLDQKIGL